MTPLKAIRQKCLDCCYDDRSYVRDCKDEKCPLWVFRMGHNPNLAGIRRKPPIQQTKNRQTASVNENILENTNGEKTPLQRQISEVK